MRVFRRSLISSLVVAACVSLAIATLAACQKNSAPFAASPAPGGNGSYAAADRADCLPAITLKDQHGRTVVLASLKGKPVLIDFIYTDCASACPLLTAKFAAIAKLLGRQLGTDITLVSVTIDPEHDHPAQLLAYSRSHEADYPGWLFLTGNTADIDGVLNVFELRRARSPDGTISHVPTIFLIGADGHQERQYDALEVAPQTVIADFDRALARG